MKVITIGRGQENDYVINEPGVSKYNTQIIKTDDGSFSIVDMGSVNGTYVNGRRISGEYPLKPGDTVIVANVSVDWHSLFAVENVAPMPASPVKKYRGGWILSIILGAVSIALIVGILFVVLYAKKQRNEDEKTIDNLNKEKAEYQYTIDITNDYVNGVMGDKENKLNELNESLSKSKDIEKRREAELKQAKEAEEAAKKLIEESREKLQDKQKELDAEKQKYNQSVDQQATLKGEIDAKDTELKKYEYEQAALKEELEAAKQALEEAQAELTKQKEKGKLAFEAALQSALDRGYTYEKICDALYFDYSEKEAKAVLYDKFDEGMGDFICQWVNANLDKMEQ